MSTVISDRQAVTEAPIEDILSMRWSPRSFDAAAVVTDEQVGSLLEAARWAASASNVQAKSGRPALVIQAEDDRLIATAHAEQLAKASGATLWVVPKASHAQCSSCAGPEYVSRIVEFVSGLSGNSTARAPDR